MNHPTMKLLTCEPTEDGRFLISVEFRWPAIPSANAWLLFRALPGRPEKVEVRRFVGKGTIWHTFPDFKNVFGDCELLFYSMTERWKFFQIPAHAKFLEEGTKS